MDAKPLVSCASPLKLPLVTAMGPFSIEAICAPPGNSSFTVLLINNSSGRNAYQSPPTIIIATTIIILRLFIDIPPQKLCDCLDCFPIAECRVLNDREILVVRCRGERKGCVLDTGRWPKSQREI